MEGDITKIKVLYNKGLSQKEVADKLGLTYKQVIYKMKKFEIPRRSWSDATYCKRNPKGDPFKIKKKLTPKERELKGFGLGLYWGEGTRSNKDSVRLGNTDPKLIKKFIEFLVIICNIDQNKLRFGLQIFSDMSPQKALNFWVQELKVKRSQSQKVIVTPTRGRGTYKNKIKHGVLTVHYCNKKLRSLINEMLL